MPVVIRSDQVFAVKAKVGLEYLMVSFGKIAETNLAGSPALVTVHLFFTFGL